MLKPELARPRRPHLLAAFVLSSVVAPSVSAEDAPQPQDTLKRLSIEQLMRIDVTTAGRRAEPVGTSSAAISVITGDDIRRSGVTTLADALQLADGVHVARTSAGSWAISARGFNQTTSNKLLVMIDGRTVYSPLFAGVFWNMLDYVLDDIDRIEVIRGPGATLWGANAVNGIVNIITRHSRSTQGPYALLSAGNEDRAVASVRYGEASETFGWRVYGKFAQRDSQRRADGASSDDGRDRGQVGFRIDGGDAIRANWMLKGDAFHSRDGFIDRPDGEFTDLSLQARWSRAATETSRVTLQSYYRREYRRVPDQLTHGLDAFDVDAQHAGTWAGRHTVVWGGGVRVNRDETHESALIRFEPASRTYTVSNAFVQDDIAVVPGRFMTTLGVKWEHNTFSGGEVQPSVRARLLLTGGHTIWGALSRAVRRPTRFEDDIVIVHPSTGATLVTGSDAFEAESLVAAEVGYRVQPAEVFSVEATGFRHEVSSLRSQEAPIAGGLPVVVGNSLEGRSHGVELGLNVQPAPEWRTHIGYTWLDTDVTPVAGSRDVGGGVSEANDPHHLFNFRTSLDLPYRIEADAMVRSVSALPSPRVPAYTELGVRVGWLATNRLEIWMAGHDLLHDRHPEFGAAVPSRVELERSVRMGVTIRY